VNPEIRGGSALAGPSRIFFVCSLWLCASLAPAAIACASKSRPPHPNLAEVWRDYRRLPTQRALAISGNIEKDRFVSGMSGGHKNIPEAEAGALRECGARRLKMGQEAACKLYAVGDEIVWPGP
jgi:hypothetical protein